MAFSYSFHISAKSHAVTNLGKVGQVGRHNLRSYEGKDYDRNLIETVVGSDDLLSDMKKVYHEEFDEALQRYNEGRRADRQIDDYITHVSDSRSDVGVEIIIQVGDEEFWRDKSLFQRSEMSQVFEEQIEALQKHCPNFKIANATIHYDEKSPHMHVVGVPVAEGYQKGMERQCAKTKVFTKETLSELQDVMRAEVEQSMKKLPSLFSTMQLKTKERGRNKDIPKARLDEFYALEKSLLLKREQLNRVQRDYNALITKAKDILNTFLKNIKKAEKAAEIEQISANAKDQVVTNVKPYTESLASSMTTYIDKKTEKAQMSLRDRLRYNQRQTQATADTSVLDKTPRRIDDR